MNILLVFISLLGLGWGNMDLEEIEENVIPVIQCRASCLDQFSHVIRTEDICKKDANCFMCWDACQLLMDNYSIWSPICAVEDVCRPGCQMACSSIGQRKDSSAFVPVSWSKLRFIYEVRTDRIRLDWVPAQDLVNNSTVLYSVLIRDENTKWYQYAQTTSQAVHIRQGLLRQNTRVRVLAANSSLLVSDSVTTYQDNYLIASDFPVPHKQVGSDFPIPHRRNMGNKLPHFGIPLMETATSLWKPVLESMEYNQMSLGLLATVTWPVQRFGDVAVKYEISWFIIGDVMEVTGHLVTLENKAPITLWLNTLYSVQVRCYTEDDVFLTHSEPLIIDTRSAFSTTTTTAAPVPSITPPVSIKCEKDNTENIRGHVAMNIFAFFSAFVLTSLILVFAWSIKRSRRYAQLTGNADKRGKVKLHKGEGSLSFKLPNSDHVIKSDSIIDLESQIFQVV